MLKKLQSILHGIARAFTIPASERKQLGASPLAPAVKAVIAAEAPAVIGNLISAHVSDPTQAALYVTAFGHLLDASGITK